MKNIATKPVSTGIDASTALKNAANNVTTKEVQSATKKAVSVAVKASTAVANKSAEDVIKIMQIYEEVQEKINRLDKTAPDYDSQVDAIYHSACTQYIGAEEVKDKPAVPGQHIYTVEKGMILPTSKNASGGAYLNAGTYTQQEILNFINEYGDPELVCFMFDLVTNGSITHKFLDGNIRTVTTEQWLQNFIDSHKDESVIQNWEPTLSEEIFMVCREYIGHPEKVVEPVYQYTLEPLVDRYMRIVNSSSFLEGLSNFENFITLGMVDDTKLLIYGDSTGAKIGASVNLLLKAFSLGGGWSVVLKDGSIVTSQDLIHWGDRYGGMPIGQVPAGTFDEAFDYTYDDSLVRDQISYKQYREIIATPKEQRPDPSEYLSQEYIESHLEQFEDGATVLTTRSNYEKYMESSGFVGREDNSLFVLPKDLCDTILNESADISEVEKALGFPEGYFATDEIIRIDISEPKNWNLRMPSGNEAGANALWVPGGYTSGNNPEAVLDRIPLSETSVTFDLAIGGD